MESGYVETWKGIAHLLGRSERWCRYTAQRAEDPLPVFKVGGIVRLNVKDLDAWLGRQRAQGLPGGASGRRGAGESGQRDGAAGALKLIA